MGKIKKFKEKQQVATQIPKQKVQFKSKKTTSSTKNNSAPIISKSTIRLVSTSNDLLSEQTKPVTKLKNKDSNVDVNKKEIVKSVGASRITKKDKLKLKHKVLLQKIDTIKELKKKHKERTKRKKVSIIGDTNPLHDALPSLDSLLKNRRDIKIKVASASNKKKGVPKTKKRQKNLIQGVDMFKKLLSNEKYKEDPLSVISEHVKRRINAGEL